MNILRLKHFRVSSEEKKQSVEALLEAEKAASAASRIRRDSVDVGASLRKLRNDNHFGRSLTHVFRPEPKG